MRKIFYYEYSLKVESISLGLYSTCNLLQVIQVEKLFPVECLSHQKIRMLTLNAFITASSISNRSRESDVSDQNVTSSTQSSSDFEIVRPTENEQDERSGSLRSTQMGPRFQLNCKESFAWIEYNASIDVITCEVCSSAKEKTKLHRQLR